MNELQLQQIYHLENFEKHYQECEDSELSECICEEIRLRKIDEEDNARIDAVLEEDLELRPFEII